MHKIQKISSRLLVVFNILLLWLPLSILTKWIFIDNSLIKYLLSQGVMGNSIHTPEGYVSLSTMNWTLLSKALGFSAEALGLLPLFLSLFTLKSIFKNYHKGEIFSTVNAAYYRYLGWLFFLNAIFVKPISDCGMGLAVTVHNPPGHRYLIFNFGTPNMEAIFCGSLLIVISWVMLEASKLKDEQQFTI